MSAKTNVDALIFVMGSGASEESIRETMSQYGEVVDIQIKSTPIALVGSGRVGVAVTDYHLATLQVGSDYFGDQLGTGSVKQHQFGYRGYGILPPLKPASYLFTEWGHARLVS